MKQKFSILILLLGLLFLSACNGAQNSNQLIVSGFVSAREMRVAPEIGGAVAEVLVKEGENVTAGQTLFRMKEDVAQAQLAQAEAGVEAAQAAVAAAEAQFAAAQVQYAAILQGAQLQSRQQQLAEWQIPAVEESNLPGWYFQKEEKLRALEEEAQAATQALETQLANLEKTLQDSGNQDFIQVELRLSRAEAAMTVADSTLQQAQAAQDNDRLKTAAQQIYDAALTELQSAQIAYDRRLSETAAQDMLEARAQVAVARARMETAQDQVNMLRTGDQSLQVQAAAAAIRQSETALTQAKAGLQQAKAAQRLAELQIEKTTILAAQSGVLLTLNLKPGELVGAGSIVGSIADLDEVELTVYIPEEVYGRVQLGQKVSLRSDSFPDRTFEGSVSHIADEAEFTPRNVQTTDGRKTTVYAIKIVVPNPDHDLKPGMPVDAEFNFN